VLARCENYTLGIDLPGWAREERGAKPMSARSIVTRQRDHRRDRGKSESNDMVNDVPETERELKMCIRASQVTGYPLYFPSLKQQIDVFAITFVSKVRTPLSVVLPTALSPPLPACGSCNLSNTLNVYLSIFTFLIVHRSARY